MTRRHTALMTLPVLFAAACVDLAEDGDAESSTDQAATRASPDPTQDPRPPAASGTPSVSPSVAVEVVAPGQNYTCALGTLCVGAWDPAVSKWRVFKLFTCRTYSLNQFNGGGFYWDNQTGHPASTFYNQNRVALVPPSPIFPGGGQILFNWDPVWFIKNC